MSSLWFLGEDENDSYAGKWSRLAELDDEDMEEDSMMIDDNQDASLLNPSVEQALLSSNSAVNDQNNDQKGTQVGTIGQNHAQSSPRLATLSTLNHIQGIELENSLAGAGVYSSPRNSKRPFVASDTSSVSSPKRRKTFDNTADPRSRTPGHPDRPMRRSRTSISSVESVLRLMHEEAKPGKVDESKPESSSRSPVILNDVGPEPSKIVKQSTEASTQEEMTSEASKSSTDHDIGANGTQPSDVMQGTATSSPNTGNLDKSSANDVRTILQSSPLQPAGLSSPQRNATPKATDLALLHENPLTDVDTSPKPPLEVNPQAPGQDPEAVPPSTTVPESLGSHKVIHEDAIALIPKELLRELFTPVLLEQIARHNSSINADEALKAITDEEILTLANLMPAVMAQYRASEGGIGDGVISEPQEILELKDKPSSESPVLDPIANDMVLDTSTVVEPSSTAEEELSKHPSTAEVSSKSPVALDPVVPVIHQDQPIAPSLSTAVEAENLLSINSAELESPEIPLIQLVPAPYAGRSSKKSDSRLSSQMVIVDADSNNLGTSIGAPATTVIATGEQATGAMAQPTVSTVCCAFQGSLLPISSRLEFEISEQVALEAQQWTAGADSLRSSTGPTRFQIRLFSDLSESDFGSSSLNWVPLPLIIRVNGDGLKVFGSNASFSNNKALCITPFIVPGLNTIEVFQTGSLEGWTLFVEQVQPSGTELEKSSVQQSKAHDWRRFLGTIASCRSLQPLSFDDNVS